MAPGAARATLLIVLAVLLLVASASVAGTASLDARDETVRIAAPDTGTLVGTLAHPDARGPDGRTKAIVLLHGSEPGRRDGWFFGTVRARLRADGWIVLTYDRRGVGDSNGRYVETPDLRVPAGDAAAAVRFLRRRDDVDPRRIGVLGVSQGGWVAPLVATTEPVAFVVAVSEPGVTPFEQSAFQRAAELAEDGMTPAAADSVTALRRTLFLHWKGDVPRARADSAWAAARGRPWFAKAAERDELFSRIAAAPAVPPRSRLPEGFTRAIDEHFFFDPLAVAERVRVPVLHLYGAADRHLPVATSIAALRAAYARAGHRAATFRTIAHAGHAMQRVDGAAECLRCPAGTRGPAEPAAGWLDALSAWLANVPARPDTD